MITLFYGGVVNLGRNMNVVLKTREPFVGIKEMAEADIRLVDLECVIAAKGEQQPLENHFYFRANPEQTNILAKNDIDIVLTANDHSGDYGADALLEQREYLDAAGILHAGSGKNISEAFAPVFKKVNDITVAIFSVDTIMPTFAATEDKPGTAYLPVDNLELWKEIFTDKINAARAKADVVIVAPHWGANLIRRPSEETRNLAHLLIDFGADAILGCNSHIVQGVEVYKDRPIVYDAGDFLFDFGRRNGGCFTLEISANGVEKINFIPLVVMNGRTHRARNSAASIVKNFIAACNEFKTVTTTAAKSTVEILFNPPPHDVELDEPEIDDSEDMLYKSEPGKIWTAGQLAKITGGEWIVPPPKGWYVQSFSKIDNNGKMLMTRPTLFLATAWNLENYPARILENISKLDGALVTNEIEGLPPDFPLLKVDNIPKATNKIGFAAKKRFQGKTIAVTGSAGKTTTCNMLRQVLIKEHSVVMTPRNQNLYQ